jgi:ligand-binding sensor domain-containing protein
MKKEQDFSPDRDPECGFQDSKKTFWLSFNTGILSKSSDGASQFFDSASIRKTGAVYRIHESKDGAVWFFANAAFYTWKTNKFSAYRYFGGTFSRYGDMEGLGFYGAFLGEDHEGALYIYELLSTITADGTAFPNFVTLGYLAKPNLHVFHNGVWEKISPPSTARNLYFITFLLDRSGTLWVGSTNGLWRYKDQVWDHFTIDPTDKKGMLIYAIVETNDNHFIIGTGPAAEPICTRLFHFSAE